MYLAVMVGKFVKQVVREWCPSTTGPLLPTMTDSSVHLHKHKHTAKCPNQDLRLGPSWVLVLLIAYEIDPEEEPPSLDAYMTHLPSS